jgi:hypothetical protein
MWWVLVCSRLSAAKQTCKGLSNLDVTVGFLERRSTPGKEVSGKQDSGCSRHAGLFLELPEGVTRGVSTRRITKTGFYAQRDEDGEHGEPGTALEMAQQQQGERGAGGAWRGGGVLCHTFVTHVSRRLCHTFVTHVCGCLLVCMCVSDYQVGVF